MEKNVKNNREQYVIDVMHIVKSLWRRAWIIILATVLVGAAACAGTMFLVTPMYSSSIMMYVNNTSLEVGEIVQVTASSLSAAQNLVKSYVVILNTRTTLEQVAKESGLGYSAGELQGMLSAGPVNETEIFRVTVTCADPYDAALIAESIGDVLAKRTEQIIEGTKVRMVDTAVVNTAKVSPSITKNTIMGMAAGFALSCVVLAILALMDDTIHDEEYILQNYDLPVLAKIPDLLTSDGSGKKYSYYNSYKHSYKSRSGDKK